MFCDGLVCRIVGQEHDRKTVRSFGTDRRCAVWHDAAACVPVEQILLIIVRLEQRLPETRAPIR